MSSDWLFYCNVIQIYVEQPKALCDLKNEAGQGAEKRFLPLLERRPDTWVKFSRRESPCSVQCGGKNMYHSSWMKTPATFVKESIRLQHKGTKTMMNCFLRYDGLTANTTRSRFISFGADLQSVHEIKHTDTCCMFFSFCCRYTRGRQQCTNSL